MSQLQSAWGRVFLKFPDCDDDDMAEDRVEDPVCEDHTGESALQKAAVPVNQDEAIMAQVEQIQKEIAESSKLVGDLEDLSCLEAEYASDDHVYQAKIKASINEGPYSPVKCSIPRPTFSRKDFHLQSLKDNYSRLRRTRGDGNCFYRAFAFAYMERLLDDSSDQPRFLEMVTKIRDVLLGMGYPSFTLEDFHDTFVDIVESTTKPEATLASLLENFQDQGTADYIVCYLRLLTSGYLQSKGDFFQAFMEGGFTVKQFCSKEVEPMYVESDHIHITALTEAVGVGVRVRYMDRGEGGQVNHHDFPEGVPPSIHLLYRPGHYDILY